MAIAPLALLTFNFGYGIVLSMLEDQISALFIGAAAGMLWQLHQMARNGAWSNPYVGSSTRSLLAMMPSGFNVRGRTARAH